MGALGPTFIAAIRAVGTAATMAFAGFYLHKRNFVTPSGKKMLALLSQQVTIPAYLFAKIIYCPRNKIRLGPDVVLAGDDIICPSVANRLSDVWIILLWPFFVVPCGLLTGYVAARLSDTPKSQVRSCLVSCAFGNSTGLAMTLLTVIHDQFKSTTELGSVDATAFLSVYLLLYPVLQWGVGGWLMAPPEDREEKQDIQNVDEKFSETIRLGNLSSVTPVLSDVDAASSRNNPHHRRVRSLHLPHLLNNDHFQTLSAAKDAGEEEFGGVAPIRIIFEKNDDEHRRFLSTGRIDSSGSGLATMIKELSFVNLCIEGNMSSSSSLKRISSTSVDDGDSSSVRGVPSSPRVSPPVSQHILHENTPLINGRNEYSCNGFDGHGSESLVSKEELKAIHEQDITPLTETMLRVATKVFQPPVIGALMGLFIASFPKLRGILVNIWAGSTEPAPLQWMFEGIYAVGQAAVPINMTILGINLSSTFQRKTSDDAQSNMLPKRTMLAVVVGKMLVMPLIGILSTWFLQEYFLNFPDEIDGTCYLVMMIVFITPTANNVMVMVELSGSSSKEGMARLIGYQYLVSPVILSLVLSAVVSLASCHFDKGPVC